MIQLRTAEQIVREVFGLTDPKAIKNKMKSLVYLASKGSPDFRAKKIGNKWYFELQSFAPEKPEPKRHMVWIKEVMARGGR